MSRMKLQLTNVYSVITCNPMKGLGFLFILLTVFSVGFSSLKDSCHTEQNCTMTSITCNNELPSNGPTDDSGHCLFHCAHNVGFVFSSFEIQLRPPLQEQSFAFTHLFSSMHATGPFRPPIA